MDSKEIQIIALVEEIQKIIKNGRKDQKDLANKLREMVELEGRLPNDDASNKLCSDSKTIIYNDAKIDIRNKVARLEETYF